MNEYLQRYVGKVLGREKGILFGKKCWFCTVKVPVLDGQFLAKPYDGKLEPGIGDWVFVVFQDGDVEQPLWVASPEAFGGRFDVKDS